MLDFRFFQCRHDLRACAVHMGPEALAEHLPNASARTVRRFQSAMRHLYESDPGWDPGFVFLPNKLTPSDVVLPWP